MNLQRIWKTAAAAAVSLSVLLTALPAQADRIHVAQEGTTYYRIAQKYSVKLDSLLKANPSIAPNNIYPGLRIVVPVAEAGAASRETLPAGGAAALHALSVTPAEKTVEAWGKTFNYSGTLQVKATAYSSAASENGWGPIDYFGNPLKLGTIAVDPSVIPLGTKVLVTGHSHPGLPKTAFVATATDTGSAIKGNRVDIFIPGSQSFVSEFGFQYVTLYFID
ncbi:LysM peptidoglycan-binding domain-containing protein [Paenibacillus spiritus]|uniref:LysM peptidoglycan-binding domain-containing protein n=1 Tax=Paenibacillus spiritus TaxID=2496557 RepID=A0A5J5GEC6_9BACL|nr:3D domain-containing protein [Paenibacillus spiritus]KAA9006549.1 LysM peptidoglycan-binding domain-containing protein [Paenibacillus spiritus]